MALAAHGAGLRVVVLNNRGRGGVPLRTAKSYCASFTGDIRATIARMHVRAFLFHWTNHVAGAASDVAIAGGRRVAGLHHPGQVFGGVWRRLHPGRRDEIGRAHV